MGSAALRAAHPSPETVERFALVVLQMKSLPIFESDQRHRLNLDLKTIVQCPGRHHCARGFRVARPLGIQRVACRPVREIVYIHTHLLQPRDVAACGFQRHANIVENLLRLISECRIDQLLSAHRVPRELRMESVLASKQCCNRS